jgi:fatty-acyl-CoA synthase
MVTTENRASPAAQASGRGAASQRTRRQSKVYRSELTPLSFLRRSAYVFPDEEAVVYGTRRYSYRQFEARVNRLASRLRAQGLQKHDRVAFLCPNIPAMLEAHFAVPAAGGILVTINTRLSSAEVDYLLRHAGVRYLFVDVELESLIAPLDTTGLEVLRIADTGAPGDPYEDYLAQGSAEAIESWLKDD